MNKKCIRSRRSGKSWYNTGKSLHSVPEVNATVGWRRFPCLPGETCLALRPAKAGSASRGDTVGDRAGVSRGRSSWRNEPECEKHSKVAGGLNPVKDRTDTMGRPGIPLTAMNLTRRARNENGSRAEKASPCASVAVPRGEATHVRHSAEE